MPSSRVPTVAPSRTLGLGPELPGAAADEPFGVASAAPEHSASSTSQIQIVFNRPLRSLEIAGAEAPAPVKLTPAIAGRWQWVGTNAVVFAPERGRLPGATAVRVEVPAGTRALDGSSLAKSFVLTFETPRPELVRSLPYDGRQDLEPGATFELFFNQAMDAKVLSSVLALRAISRGQPRAVTFRVAAAEPGASKRFVLTPAERLPIHSQLELELGAAATSLEGPLPAGKSKKLQFATYGPLRVSSVDCSRDSSDRACRPKSSAWLELTNPVKMRDVKRSVRIEPPLKLTWDSYVADDDLTTTISLSAPFQPGQRYKVELDPALTDKYGQRLGRFSTELKFDDYLPLVEIGVTGDYLEATKRGPIPVGSVNVAIYELAARALSEAEVTRMLSIADHEARFEYVASLTKPRQVRPTAAKNQIDRQELAPSALLAKSGGFGALAIGTRYQSPRERRPRSQLQLVQVTDLAVTAKLSRTDSLVWITRLSTGQPVSGAEVYVTSAKNPALRVRAVTDASGLARLDTRASIPEWLDDPALLVARSGSDWTYRALRDFIEPWSLPVAANPFAEDRTYGLMFTERGIYRPGDVVKVKGIVRREAEGGNTVVRDRSLQLELYTPEAELVTTYALKTNVFGTFTADVRVPGGAALGGWRLSLAGSEAQIATDFQVAEYRPAEFKVQVQSDKPEYRRGQTAAFEIRGDYLFGAPMPGADLRYSISRNPSSFAPPGADGLVTDASLYYFALEDESPAGGVLGNAGVKLDPSGRFAVEQALTLPNQRGPELVRVDAEVTDLSRQAIASSTTSIVHASDVYVALAPLEDMFVKAPGPVRPKLLTLAPDGRRVPARNVKLELVQRRWTIARVQAGGEMRSESKIVDSVVGSCTLQSALEPRSCELSVPQAGYYLILATAKDKLGGQAQAAIGVYGLGKGSVSWPDNDSQKLELVLDKKQYRVGDTARVLVKSPFPEAEALLAIESGSAKSERRVVLSGPTPTFDVPVTEAFRPNAFVSVHLLRGRSSPAPTAPGKPDVGAPTYRFGYAELKVDAEARRLKVDIKPRRRDLRPGAEAQLDVRVTRSDGTPERAELTLYAVDEGVLTLVDYRIPDPLQTFTEPRPLRTATLEARSSLARSGLLAFAELLGLEKGAAGGGGGEGALGARRDFRQTAYYNANLVTGADGAASVSFRLPDTLTTFRVMGVATSQDDRYGHGQSTLTTSKPLMARPALPRLLRAGDTLQASLIVSAKDFGPAEADVSLEASGVALSGPSSQRVKLAKNGSVEVRFPLSAPATTEAKFRFDVRALGERDAVELVRRVDSPAALEAVALYGRTESASAERLGDLSTIRRDVGGLEVSLASTALVGIDQGFEQLADYPYGCTEQLSSRLLPLLPLRELARDFGFDPPRDTNRSIELSLGEILRRQRGDGGFAMWPESEESSAWVSPYTLWVLFEAKKRGAVVPPQAIDRGRDYLRRQLERAERDAVDRATRAFVLFVLARLGKPDPGYETRLFAERETLPVFARAFLLEAMVLSKNDPKSRDTLARELEGAVKLVADRAVVTEELGDEYASVMDSDARTSAITLAALLSYRPAHTLGPRLARGLLEARRGGTWRSTQETAFALLALDAYRKAQERVEPNFVARLWLGGKRLLESTFRGRSAHAHEHFVAARALSGGDLVFDKEGAGQLFYAARLRYARTRLPSSALDRGFYVQKTLRAVSPESLRAALGGVPAQGESRFAPGALVLADLIVVTPSPRDYVVVDDPLPAGFEGVDTRLSTTAAWLRVPGSEVAQSDDELAEGNARLWSSYRQELRDDRALFFVDHMAAGVHHYRYLARATALGRFVVPPTKAEEMYAPEVFGRTAAATVEVQ